MDNIQIREANEDIQENRVLRNNKIAQFILRIDIDKRNQIDFAKLADDLKDDYDFSKQEVATNLNLDLDNCSVKKEEFINYILTRKQDVSLKLTTLEKSICIQAAHYETKEVYEELLNRIIECIVSQNNSGINAMRIGMRYVNIFSCPKKSDISKILCKKKSDIIKGMLEKENTIRSIAIEEFQTSCCNGRVQYGIPNKFYPSIIKQFDIVLDIDVYVNGIQEITEWKDIVSCHNHIAFDTFISYINKKQLELLK